MDNIHIKINRFFSKHETYESLGAIFILYIIYAFLLTVSFFPDNITPHSKEFFSLINDTLFINYYLYILGFFYLIYRTVNIKKYGSYLTGKDVWSLDTYIKISIIPLVNAIPVISIIGISIIKGIYSLLILLSILLYIPIEKLIYKPIENFINKFS